MEAGLSQQPGVAAGQRPNRVVRPYTAWRRRLSPSPTPATGYPHNDTSSTTEGRSRAVRWSRTCMLAAQTVKYKHQPAILATKFDVLPYYQLRNLKKKQVWRSRRHCCAWPVPDKYAFQRQKNEQTNKHRNRQP